MGLPFDISLMEDEICGFGWVQNEENTLLKFYFQAINVTKIIKLKRELEENLRNGILMRLERK